MIPLPKVWRMTNDDQYILCRVWSEIIFRNPGGCESHPYMEQYCWYEYRRTLNL